MKERPLANWNALMSSIRATRNALRHTWFNDIAENKLSATQGATLMQLTSMWERSAEVIAALKTQTVPLKMHSACLIFKTIFIIIRAAHVTGTTNRYVNGCCGSRGSPELLS